jgi:hypothetical protein
MRSASTCHKPRRFIPSTVLVAALAMGAAGARAQTSIPIAPYGPAGPDRFRSQTELVVLQVSVVDQHGRFVTGLGVNDFGVFEDGVRQSVTFFASNAAPLDLVLLIDTSSSMFGRMALAQDAAIDLIRTLKPGDRGAVVLFSHTIRIAHPLTGDFARLESAIRGAVPTGATAVYEALYVTLRDLARSRAEPGEPRRQAVVVLSDGEDNRSHVEFGDLLDEAQRMTTTIFTILPGPFPDPDLAIRHGRSQTRCSKCERWPSRPAGARSRRRRWRIWAASTGRLPASSVSSTCWHTRRSPLPSTGSGASPSARKRVRTCGCARAAGMPPSEWRRDDRRRARRNRRHAMRLAKRVAFGALLALVLLTALG